MNESEDVFFDLEARKRLSQTILAWMDAAGTNRNRLAISTGMSRNTLNAILKGSRSASLEILAQLAAALNTSIGALVDGVQPKGAVTPPATPGRLQEVAADVVQLREDLASTQDGLSSMEDRISRAVALLGRETGLPDATIQRMLTELRRPA